MDIITRKGILISLISPLIKLELVTIQSLIHGEVVGFEANLIGLSYGDATDPFILVSTDEGMQFGVSLEELSIKVGKLGA
jgi:hypothetical protein